MLEFCYTKNHRNIIDYAYDRFLKNSYKTEKYLEYCKIGDFEGVLVCLRNGVDID